MEGEDSMEVVATEDSQYVDGEAYSGIVGYKQQMVRKQRCGECAGCKATDCEVCKFCLNMKKFGGPGTLKQPCVQRKCTGEVFAIVGSTGESSDTAGSSITNNTQQSDVNNSKLKESVPFVDNVAETGIFSALSIIKPRAPSTNTTDATSSSTTQAVAESSKPKTEVEIFEPYDPTVGGEILDRVNIGYDSNAAAYFSALESGTAMSRCECMASNTIKYTPRASDNNQDNSFGQSSQLRASVIASVPMEKGIRAMDMAPLPTYIYGEGMLGNPIPINLQTTMPSNSSSSSSSSSSASTRGEAERAPSGPPAAGPNRKAYGLHYKAPKPFRNAQGELIITLHLSRMINVTISKRDEEEEDEEEEDMEEDFLEEDEEEEEEGGPPHVHSEEEGASLIQSSSPSSPVLQDNSDEVSSDLMLSSTNNTNFTTHSLPEPTMTVDDEEGGEEEQVSALDRLKNRGRKRKVPPPITQEEAGESTMEQVQQQAQPQFQQQES